MSNTAIAAESPKFEAELHRIDWLRATPFFVVHIAAVVGVAVLGWSWSGFALAIALYYVRMFGVTGGYHRYFSHRAYRTSRWFQLVLAVLAMTSVQKGVLWWASHHRIHHKLSDKPGDVHSVLLDGFWWSHVGWIISKKYHETEDDKVKDLAKFPELVWLNEHHLVPVVAFAVATWMVGSWWGLLWGFFVSTALLWHGTFTINSLTHMFGRRRYVTGDNSRNSFILALVTTGEGWHNNHHYYQRSANQGFFWWEIDPTFYVLKGLELVGIVWDVHTPPKHVLDGNRIADLPAVPAPSSSRPSAPSNRATASTHSV
ncbi:MAG TPA: acyl-CoA desaturase [Polyangiaceae bacterium]